MPESNQDGIQVIKVQTDWLNIEVLDGPEVVLTRRGYIPSLIVKIGNSDLSSRLFIGSWSIAEKLEPMRRKNQDSFKGLKFKVRKESLDKFGKYQVEKL
ncbi:MAG: hypothetical protein ABII23_00310 [bacterium]